MHQAQSAMGHRGSSHPCLRRAGAADVREKTLRFNIGLPSLERYFEIHTAMSESLRDKLRMMPDAERE